MEEEKKDCREKKEDERIKGGTGYEKKVYKKGRSRREKEGVRKERKEVRQESMV